MNTAKREKAEETTHVRIRESLLDRVREAIRDEEGWTPERFVRKAVERYLVERNRER